MLILGVGLNIFITVDKNLLTLTRFV